MYLIILFAAVLRVIGPISRHFFTALLTLLRILLASLVLLVFHLLILHLLGTSLVAGKRFFIVNVPISGCFYTLNALFTLLAFVTFITLLRILLARLVLLWTSFHSADRAQQPSVRGACIPYS